MGFLDKLFSRAPQVVPERVRSMAEFERMVLGSDLPVIVDVWSPSCAPCRKLEPVLLDVAARYQGRVRVAEIGTADAEPALLSALEVQSTPTLIIYRQGEELGRASGLRPASWFDQMIEAELS